MERGVLGEGGRLVDGAPGGGSGVGEGGPAEELQDAVGVLLGVPGTNASRC